MALWTSIFYTVANVSQYIFVYCLMLWLDIHLYPNEFCNGIIVPLLNCKHGDAIQLDMYRGITLSPVLSKLFESVLLDLFLTSSDLQFGFKKNLGCSHALFAFNETVRYFMNNNSLAFWAFLDISKAFDKVLHNGLFTYHCDTESSWGELSGGMS